MSETEQAEKDFPFDIAIVGLGIVGVHQITREVEETIRRCRQTFVVDSGFGVVRYLESLCGEVTSLVPLYETGKSRLSTYRRMAAEVVNAAIACPPVAFASYGHPLVYCFPTALIRRAAKILNLRVEVLPGVSALDTLLVDLGIDFADNGLQVYEATDLLLRRRPVQSDVPCVLWQANVFADLTYQTHRRAADQFKPLQDYLLQFYPPDHPIKLVISKTFPLLRSIVETYRIGTLAVDLENGPQAGTLYIPPVTQRAIEDQQLFETLTTQS
ncbi:MAG TPA: SAM-dependent methyltransferase [Chthoniobacterales bacterium]|nr:SAM-dependent methyltransferase [Chthoniobacterales bacterium]